MREKKLISSAGTVVRAVMGEMYFETVEKVV